MPDDSPSSTPPVPQPQSPLDRGALERVLARAAGLQASAADTGEMMTAEQLLEVGKEVGIAPDYLRQALAEERSRAGFPRDEGVLARMFGGAIVSASRTFPGTPAAVMAALDSWLQGEECLHIKRRFTDRTVWERRPGVTTWFRRGLNIGGRGYYLARAHEVSGTVLAVDAERVLVRLDADVSNVRGQYVASGGAIIGTNVAAAGVLLALGLVPVVALAPVVVGAGIGYAVSRGHRGVAARVRLALEQTLDQLERGEAPRVSLLDRIATSARGIRIDI
ncbi:MAG: hypothetical protein ACREON_03485 [Gemmatimonadaceae bacterium]